MSEIVYDHEECRGLLVYLRGHDKSVEVLRQIVEGLVETCEALEAERDAAEQQVASLRERIRKLARYDKVTEYRYYQSYDVMERDDKYGDWVQYDDLAALLTDPALPQEKADGQE